MDAKRQAYTCKKLDESSFQSSSKIDDDYVLPFARYRRIARHRLRRHLEIAIRPVEEALPSLGEVLQDEAGRWGCSPIEGTSSGTRSILHIETEIKLGLNRKLEDEI